MPLITYVSYASSTVLPLGIGLAKGRALAEIPNSKPPAIWVA
jgi:hypothetical protein